MRGLTLDSSLLAFVWAAWFSHFTFSPLSCWFRTRSCSSCIGPQQNEQAHTGACDMFFSFSLTTLSPSHCCWLGSVLGSTCPQNEYTFACIRALPWLAFYPLCRRVWLMIRVCHFSQQPGRPPACSHIKHPNVGKNVEFDSLHVKNVKQMLAYALANAQEYNI